MNKIKQCGEFLKTKFKSGDLLKIYLENDGTKNVYVGRFLFFDSKRRWSSLFSNVYISENKLIVCRNHTLCEEGVLKIPEQDIYKIKVIKEWKK